MNKQIKKNSLVFPDASRPSIRIRISFLPNIFDNAFPIPARRLLKMCCLWLATQRTWWRVPRRPNGVMWRVGAAAQQCEVGIRFNKTWTIGLQRGGERRLKWLETERGS